MVLSALLLLPAVILMNSSEDEPEEPVAATSPPPARARIDGLLAFVPDAESATSLVDSVLPIDPSRIPVDRVPVDRVPVDRLEGEASDPDPVALAPATNRDVDRIDSMNEFALPDAPVASIASTVVADDARPAPAPQQGRPLPPYLRADEQPWIHSDSGPTPKESYDCIIEPHELVEVGSALTAVVESVEVERSDFVSAGQIVARLEAAPERASASVASARARMDGELLAHKARMALGGRKQDRAERLFEREALSVDLRDEVRTEAEVARAAHQDAQEHKELMELQRRESMERLREHTIRTPISGVVVDRLKSRGEVVKEETIVVVAQIDPLRVEVVLPAQAFGSVRLGMHAEVVPELPNSGAQVALVTIVDRVVDATSGTFGVWLELPNADHAVPSGLRCQARFLQVD